MSQSGVDAAAAAQKEKYRAVQINSVMQAIAAVPMFDGSATDLEFFIKRMDLIAEQMTLRPVDDATTNYILGYFYSRIAVEVIMELGVAVDAPWPEVKQQLREKYGGAAKSIPRLIMREVLVPRESAESATKYAKALLLGFRKVKSRIADAGWSKEEVQARTAMLEELAQEVLNYNLPRRVKQWVKIAKPPTLEALVKVVEDEECEEKEERLEEIRRRPNRPQQHQGYQREAGWKVVEYRNRNRLPRSKPQTPAARSYERGERAKFKKQDYGFKKWTPPRTGRCYECNEVGHFARECPWMYRRGERQPQSRSYAEATRHPRPEPMEVNAGDVETRSWRRYSSTEEGSEGEAKTPGRKEARGPAKRTTDDSDRE